MKLYEEGDEQDIGEADIENAMPQDNNQQARQ